MIVLKDLVSDLLDVGYDDELATAKLCQDIILKAIATSSLSKNITIKGGVVMRELTNNIRRATKDLDLDFIRYSISDESIELFLEKINVLEGVSIEKVGDIETLKQQDYQGKRVHIEIRDGSGYTIEGKLDIGVHNDLDIEQEEYCFEVSIDNSSVTMIINSKEQIFAEKLYSLLKRATMSTRYKDIFDMHYLSAYIEREKLLPCIEKYIFKNPKRENSIEEIVKKLETIFKNKRYIERLKSSNKNWEDVDVIIVLEELLLFFKKMI